MPKKILCVPFDPVHDVGIKLIRNELDKHGYTTELLSPDLPLEKIVKEAASDVYDYILVSRTIGYGVAELLGRLIDLLDAAGVRERSKIVIGGKAITPELAAELGFDKGFGEHSPVEAVIAYIEGKEWEVFTDISWREKKNLTKKYSYEFLDSEIELLLDGISDNLIKWSRGKSSDGIERARLREEMMYTDDRSVRCSLFGKYLSLCDPVIVSGYRDHLYPKGVRELTEEELAGLDSHMRSSPQMFLHRIQQHEHQPAVFKFLGSGCPVMDIMHGKICERRGVDGFLIINPSWEARYEGLLEGNLTHQNDGTITTLENILLLRKYFEKNTLITVRAHRGLNTPETVLLAGEAGADMTKINLVYGSLGAGTDPERLAVDGIEAMKLSARYGMPFDIPGNDELSGVPARKTLAGLLINAMIGLKLGAKPILKPLFCYGPHNVLNGTMKQNFIDFNAAKIYALRRIVKCPVWPGEPIAFMTQTEDRVQSANATSYHAALAASLGVDAITIASTDEAYSRGPISISSRIDSIKAVTDAFRFMGDAEIKPTVQAECYTDNIIQGIKSVLRDVNTYKSLPEAIYDGKLGGQGDGAYPGTFGRGTVVHK
jgi:methylmalonyl-CoA mutase cobalamin-binding subunit